MTGKEAREIANAAARAVPPTRGAITREIDWEAHHAWCREREVEGGVLTGAITRHTDWGAWNSGEDDR
jgi:hypothetical protein